MLGIIGAMEEEVAAILKEMKVVETKEKLNYKFYRGTIADKECVVLQGGVGKVNAAISATLLFENYHPELLINIGSAGGLQPHLAVGDVVIGQQVAYHDADVTAFSYQYGQMAGGPLYFEADQNLMVKMKTILENEKKNIHVGLIVSGDQFVAQQKQVEVIQNHFPHALCAEMEAAAIAQTCHVYKIPFIITRSLSDVFGKGDSDVQFDEYLQMASQASAKMCRALVEQL